MRLTRNLITIYENYANPESGKSRVEQNAKKFEPTNEIIQEDYDDSDLIRNKRQAGDAEQIGGDPEMGEIQGIWQGMWETLVDGAKQIVKKVAQSFDQDPEQQQPPM